ncbi:MAG: class I tRNA ligase family protein [Candidatus Levybacteria bacterium]|nr:class I tRNA ligase family protein [Candidatus Levybacteria bacterium]
MRHKTIKKVTNDLSNFRYNTAISALMEYYNFLVKQERLDREDYLVFLKLLAPFAPHLTEELWQNMHMQSASIHKQAWPIYNDSLLVDDELTIVVQVNGKLRDSFIIESDKAMNKNEVENVARSLDRIQQYLNDDNQKIIFVPGKIINFVTN